MAFQLPAFLAPDFAAPALRASPVVGFEPAPRDGVAPANFHATSIFPEYLHVNEGEWHLLRESRMDCVVVMGDDGTLSVREFRHLKMGEMVAVGRGEDGEEGILVHTGAFEPPRETSDKFAFRTRISRETSFSIDYDELYDLLAHERECGFILWVLGPAVTFDHDARQAFVGIIESGYVHALTAGNALAVHDLEASLSGTALGQEIYSKKAAFLGHYHHLDAINTIRAAGSIAAAVEKGIIRNGIMRAAIRAGVPHVLAGSIRDDGPLPEVVADVYTAQDRMRELARKATTVIALATQLHSIATGNVLAAYRVMEDGTVRPVYFYSVDMSEFAADKLANRGSLAAHAILTNVQDFVVTLERGLRKRCA